MHPGCDIEQVYLCQVPVDFRKSITGLSVLVEQVLKLNPFGSALYVLSIASATRSRCCTGIAMVFVCGPNAWKRGGVRGQETSNQTSK